MQVKSMKANAALNGIKTLAAIVFPLITYPYISRVLGADNLGKINFANSIVNYFSLIAALGISNYAIREGAALREDTAKMHRFANQLFTINLCFTGVAYLLMGIVLAMSRSLDPYRNIIIVQSLIIIMTTLGVEWLFSIYEDYFYITIRTIIVQVASLILMVFLVKKADDYLRYALISVMATGGAYLINFFYSKKYFRIHPVRHVDWKKNMKPMLLLFFNTLAITIYVNSDITILGFLKGDYYVGIYSTSVKIYTILKQVVNALIVASLPRMSFYVSSGQQENYNLLLRQILKALLLVLMPMVVGVIMLSPDIVILVSGKEFADSAASLQLLSVAIGFSLLASFFTTAILLPHKKDKSILQATIFSALLNLGLNFVLIPLLAEKGAAITTVLAEFLVMLIAIYHSKGDYQIVGIRKAVLEGITGMVCIAGICGLVNYFIDKMFLRLTLGIGVSVLCYFIILLVCREDLLLETLRTFFHKKR